MFTNMSSTYTEANLISSLQDLKQRLQQLTPTLDKIEVMLQYTTATSNLPQTQIDGYKATVDAYQLQVQTKSSTITEQINLMQSFFSSYKDNQSSALKQKELIEQQAKVTESTLGDSEEIARLQVERAEATYNQAVTSKQKNIPSLKNTIDQAQIAVSEAYDQLNKFEVLTPIDGTIGQVLVDVGQEVSAGTPLVTIKSTNSQQVEIALTQEELSFVTVGQEVSVTNGDDKTPGIIMSISKSADQFFTYPAIVELTEVEELFGDLVSVEIEVRTEYPLIPLNVVTILNNNEGLINRRDDEKIAPLRVQLGKVRGEFIEIRTKLEEDLVVIISDVKNYNSTRHTLEEQK
ncbi:HlyD family efflux transporter periplasmic adaptor subunit [Patescibacteria group bacterium]|nr:HlyD family efflux transporter periplasmic adaptor subunit [Patescibacteria group bacterium]